MTAGLDKLKVLFSDPLTGAVCAAALLLALILGWLLGRKKRGPSAADTQPRARRTPSEDAFLRGLAHMMADHTDKAIEEFTRAVTLNSDTVETYVVLGNLFRQKGEIERAVRIRQSIILRPNLDPEVKLQALLDLALDYRKGGLYNRAAEVLEEVLRSYPDQVEALRQLVSLYEEMRDWENAFEALKRLDKKTGSNSKNVLAHYKTELGKEAAEAMQSDAAEQFFSQAISVDKECLDAHLHLGDLELSRGRDKKALTVWRKAVKLAPTQAHLVISRVNRDAGRFDPKQLDAFFNEIDTANASPQTLAALAARLNLQGKDHEALDLLALAIERFPKYKQAHLLRGEIVLKGGDPAEVTEAFEEILGAMEREEGAYQCRECGHVTHQLTWKCPRCHAWDTVEAQLN